MHNKAFKKEAFKDCIRIMAGSILFSTFYEFIVILVQTLSARTIGSFTNAILSVKYDLVKNNLWFLLILVLMNIILEPSLGVLKDIFLFKQALTHHSEVVLKFLNKDYLKAKRFEAGELSSRWEKDLLNYRTSVIIMVSKPLLIIPSFILVSFYIFHNWIYGIVCILAALFPVITAYFTSPIESRYFMKNREYESKKRTLEFDLSTGHSYLKMNLIGEQFLSKLDNLFKNFFNEVEIKEIDLRNTISFLNSVSKYTSQIIVVIFGTYLLSKDVILAGDIASYLGYLLPIQKIMNEFSVLIRQIRLHQGISNRVIEFYTDYEKTNGNHLKDPINEISLENISFSYNEAKTVIDNFSLSLCNLTSSNTLNSMNYLNKHVSLANEKDLNNKIPIMDPLFTGKKILLYGENGSGKSTLFKIIIGLYCSYNGKLSVNGINYTNFNIDSIRKRISYIEQSPYFFNGTLEENIKIVNPNITREKILELINKFQINKALSDEIRDNGSNLSGGEKQKLSIIRGLIKDADIYFFDEPTNNLDTISKDIIKDIIKNEKHTVFFITHDLDLQSIANEKILLEKC